MTTTTFNTMTTSNNLTTKNTTADEDQWQTAGRRKRPMPPRARSPTPSACSTASTSASELGRAFQRSRGSGASTASAASTRRTTATPRPRSTRPDITTLTAGAAVEGVVKSIQDFGAFVDVGVSKDGLLHISEADPTGARIRVLQERFAVGDKLQLFIKAIQADKGKFTLTAKDPSAPAPLPRAGLRALRDSPAPLSSSPRSSNGPSPRTHAPSPAATAALAQAAERARLDREAREEAARKRAEEKAYWEEQHAKLAAIEAAMMEAAAEREAAAAAARAEAGLLLPAAELLRGVELPPAPEPQTLEVLATKSFCGGRKRVLYRMPWKSAVAATA